MSFTTETLKLHKKWAERQNPYKVYEHIGVQEFLDLVARLKASEALHRFVNHLDDCRATFYGSDGLWGVCDCGLKRTQETYRQSIGQDKGDV